MVRGLEVEAHQAEQRVQEPLGLAERQAEDDPQRQRGPDREVRVPPLASAKTVLRWYPRGNCILAQPDRDVAAAPEAALVLPPVPDSVLLLVLAVDSARLRCDHDVTPPISMMGWTPPPPLACSLTPIHAPTPCTDVRSPSWIASGESVVFEVLREYLGPRDFVTIWFDHKWERANNTGIDHEVFSQVTAFAKYLTPESDLTPGSDFGRCEARFENSWTSNAAYCRATQRLEYPPFGIESGSLGFRLVRTAQ